MDDRPRRDPSAEHESTKMSRGLTHVTIGFPRTLLMEAVAETSRRNGCRFVSLPRFFGIMLDEFQNELALLRDYLESGDLGTDDIVMFTDTHDAIVVEHSSVILEKFIATGADIVFSADNHGGRQGPAQAV